MKKEQIVTTWHVTGEQLMQQVTERNRKSAERRMKEAAKIEYKPMFPLEPAQPKKEVKQPQLGDVIIEADIDHRGREVNRRVRIFGLK